LVFIFNVDQFGKKSLSARLEGRMEAMEPVARPLSQSRSKAMFRVFSVHQHSVPTVFEKSVENEFKEGQYRAARKRSFDTRQGVEAHGIIRDTFSEARLYGVTHSRRGFVDDPQDCGAREARHDVCHAMVQQLGNIGRFLREAAVEV